MGGGKALVNAYYRSAESSALIQYDAPVDAVEFRRAASSRPGSVASASGARRRFRRRWLRSQPSG
jgi:hypothetical protein